MSIRKTRSHARLLRNWLGAVVCLSILASSAWGAFADCPCDETAPTLMITAPVSGDTYVTNQPVVDIAGEVSDSVGVTYMSWSNDRGGSGTPVTTVDWNDAWQWRVDDIELVAGDNILSVLAVDAADNRSEATLTVTYELPQPPPPPSTEEVISNKKAKFTFYYGGPDYDGLDRFSIVAYLLKEPDEVFEMPFDKDVSVEVFVDDPEHPGSRIKVFSQTVPAGSISGTTKYRYVHSPPGIRELTFQRSTSVQTYMYLYVVDWDFLPAIKATLSPEDYQQFVREIQNYTLRLEIGGTAWEGTAPLTPGSYGTHKQEMVYNR